MVKYHLFYLEKIMNKSEMIDFGLSEIKPKICQSIEKAVDKYVDEYGLNRDFILTDFKNSVYINERGKFVAYLNQLLGSNENLTCCAISTIQDHYFEANNVDKNIELEVMRETICRMSNGKIVY